VRELHLRTRSPSQTREVARAVAGALRAGDVIGLTGELGAGKTVFVQGAASALGVQDRVTSPTFVLRREYRGRLPVVHLDVYRLDTLSDVLDLGFEEVLDGRAVTFIEWADAMSPLLPPSHLEVELRTELDLGPEDGDEEDARRIVLRPRGDDWHRRLGTLFDELRQWAVAGTRPRG
jgi:tRNA threonylcarbamoyladenosine biosynthesis protein TsaE